MIPVDSSGVLWCNELGCQEFLHIEQSHHVEHWAIQRNVQVVTYFLYEVYSCGNLPRVQRDGQHPAAYPGIHSAIVEDTRRLGPQRSPQHHFQTII